MKSLPYLLIFAMMVAILPSASQAATTVVYADAVVSASNHTYQPSNSLGEPDLAYTDFFSKDADITLDFGQEIESDITLHMKLLSLGAAVRVDFLNASQVKITSSSHIFGVGETQVTLSFTGDHTYRYAKIVNIEDEVWKLDAAQVVVASEEEVEEEPTEEEPPADEEEPLSPKAIDRGLLVKLADDADPNTMHDAAVYVIGSNDERHAFPSESVFFSWYENFDDVTIVEPNVMSAYQLGANVTMRPGTNLVKINTDPKVYAVEPGAVLRWVNSEAVAMDLFGDDWADRVRDVPDVFWGNYTVGDPIETSVYPEGTLGVTENGEVIYIKNGTYYSIPGSTYSYMRFQPDFFTLITDDLFDMLVDMGGLTEDPDIAFPY